MKIKTLFESDEYIDIETYLAKCDIYNVDLFLNPDASCMDDVNDYVNIREAYLILLKEIEGD